MPLSQPRRAGARADAAATLAAHEMFSGVDAEAFDHLQRFLNVVGAGKGEAIFRKGDPGEFMMLIVEGDVKIVSPSGDGKEVLLNLLGKGDIFGEIAMLDGLPRSADAIARSDCTLAMLARRDVLAATERYPSVALNFISFLCRTLRHVSSHLDDVMFLDVAGRLARAVGRVGRENGVVDLTQQELAQSIGVSRESVNQVLRAWQFRHLVRLEKGRVIIVDPAAIERLCESAR